MRISDWSSDVCSSDLCDAGGAGAAVGVRVGGDVLAARNLPAGRRGNRHGVPAPGGGRPCAAGRRAVAKTVYDSRVICQACQAVQEHPLPSQLYAFENSVTPTQGAPVTFRRTEEIGRAQV